MESLAVEVGTLTTDARLVITTWDATLTQVSGIAQAEAIGRPLRDVIPSLDERGLFRRFEEVLQTGAVHVFSPALHHYVLPCPPRRASPRFTQMQQRVTVGPLRVGDRIAGVIMAIDDVTERVDAEHDLAESLVGREDTWNARRAAVQQLARVGHSDFAHSLVNVLRTHHSNFSVLSSTLELLAGTDVDISQALGELLRHPNPDVRIQAALVLGSQRRPAAADALLAALDDEQSNVRFQVIESLGRMRAAAAVDRLALIAEQDDEFLSFAAISALGAIGETTVAPRLVPLLPRAALRPALIEALSLLADDAGLEALGAVLNVADITMALATADHQQLPRLIAILGWMPGEEARDVLIGLLDNPQARSSALEALPRHGEAILDHLALAVDAGDPDTRHAAVVAMGQLGSRRATPLLLQMLARRPEMSGVVAGALGRIGDPAAFEQLIELIGHADLGVRQAAVGALNAIGHPDMPDRIAKLLNSDDTLVLESAVRIAGYFGYAAARERILAFASTGAEPVRCAALEQLPYVAPDDAPAVLIAALQSKSPTIRVAAVKALAHIDEPRSLAALIDALRDPYIWVRYFAARAVGAHRASAAAEPLQHTASTDVAPPVRIAALEALATIAGGAARPTLIALIESSIPEVAAAAQDALHQLDRRVANGV